MSRPKHPVTQEMVREHFDYDPNTGVFIWRKVMHGRLLGGRRAGTIKASTGYRYIRFAGHSFAAGRLAWFYTYGHWPSPLIDHINGERDDDRLSNLRVATHRQNLWNSKRPQTNTSGFKGVVARPYGRYHARIRLSGVMTYLGTFDTPEEAHAAYVRAARQHFGEFARAA